ncbi:MAG: hypothetical protein AABZ11_00840 [Nitrospinota bacterium]
MNGRIHRTASLGPMATTHRQSGQVLGFPHHPPVYHGSFCTSCCHPVSKCCCHRECIKETKELLVKPAKKKADTGILNLIKSRMVSFSPIEEMEEKTDERGERAGTTIATNISALTTNLEAGRVAWGMGDAIIGGGCCVHLSIEYMQNIDETSLVSSNVISIVMVAVVDTEGTMLAWSKFKFPSGYHIKEGIITTNPGAKLTIIALNAIARVRWCEIFSC